jgi:hypothetical protein
MVGPVSSSGNNVGDGGTGEFVAVGVKVGVALAVGEGEICGVSDPMGAVGVASPALTWLTVNCKIGQTINVTSSRIIEEVVNTTPRENPVREG